MAEEPNQPFCLHRRFSLPSTLSPNGRLKVEKEGEKKEGFLLLHFPLKKEGKERELFPLLSQEREFKTAEKRVEEKGPTDNFTE